MSLVEVLLVDFESSVVDDKIAKFHARSISIHS